LGVIRKGTEEGAEHVDDFRALKGGSLSEGGEDGDVLRENLGSEPGVSVKWH